MDAYRAEIARITEIRIDDPDFPLRHARTRARRTRLTSDGRLNLIAADHPARRVTAAGGDPLAMADRADYLSRILDALGSDRVDGVMATMDLIEELLIVGGLCAEQRKPDPLAQKLLVASQNRGGLAGVFWELDDPLTGPSARACAEWKLDGVKFLLRVLDDDPGSLRTMEAAAAAVREAHEHDLPMFLEPLAITRSDGKLKVVKEPEALAKLAGVASALGDSSRRMWLKLPYCPGYETVARATTLPILLLGGESAGDYRPFLAEVEAGLAAGPNVRGALVGRNVLYPGEATPREAADAVGRLVHP